MKLYVVVRFMKHEANVEFHRVTTVTDVEVTDYHRNNVEVYVVMICSQCVMPHVTEHMLCHCNKLYPLDVGVVIITPITIHFR